jgi:UDP-N-acetylglucosamine--N-acetylmuramyl-(pentapeptide) pyrophosphoryl-undecaprenol N-acetylglucosamine transferase
MSVERRSLAVVVAGGGTGGHLYPGIAVARELLRRVPEACVSFAGTARGLEARVIPKEGFELDLIRSAGIKGKSLASRLRGAGLLPVGFADAWRILSRRRPQVVIGVGGYSSGPVVLTAAIRGIATMVLEQNAVPGLTNRLLARWVRAAAVTFEETLTHFPGRGFVAGNPVRSEFFAIGDAPHVRDRSSRARVLVLGGSQGARGINLALVAAAPELARRQPDLEIVHQAGERHLAEVRQGYERAGVAARVVAYLDAVADEMKSADLVIARAGATTLAELAAAGRPAVLVPFPAATDDHQRRNARVVEAAGGAKMVEESELVDSRRIVEIVDGLLGDQSPLAMMSRAMRGLARPDAAARIVDRMLELAGG